MSDERLRSAAWSAARDLDDEVRWLAEALRAGRISADQVRAAALLGHRAARLHVEAAASRRPRCEFPALPPWQPLVSGEPTLTVIARALARGLVLGAPPALLASAAGLLKIAVNDGTLAPRRWVRSRRGRWSARRRRPARGRACLPGPG